MTLEELNRMDRKDFQEALGAVFEHSPWVAERAWDRRPFASQDELWRGMCDVVEEAPEDKQIALIRAHPDLGARMAVGERSAAEQRSAGLDELDEETRQNLLGFNEQYREKFGYPFILAVKGATTFDIFIEMKVRLDSTPEEEFHKALFEIGRIAWFRLEDILKGSTSA